MPYFECAECLSVCDADRDTLALCFGMGLFTKGFEMSSAKIVNIPVDNTSILGSQPQNEANPQDVMDSGLKTKLRDGDLMPLQSPNFPNAGLR